MTPGLARRVALATLQPVMFDIVADAARSVAAGRPVQVDYGFTVAEVETAEADRAELAGVYREVSARQDFTTATLAARLGWLAGLAAVPAADRRRLDWLEARHAIDIVCYPPDVGPTFAPVRYTVEAWGVRRVEARGLGPTLRAAIDAAMAGWAAKGGQTS